MTAIFSMLVDGAEKHQLTGGWLLRWLSARISSLWFHLFRLNTSILHIEQHTVCRRDSLLWNVQYSTALHKMKYCTCTHIHTHIHTQAVVVVDGRPQGVGRQPVSQNEAQSNHSEMNALEDSQNHNIKHTDTHREWEERDTESKQLLATLCVCVREIVCVH